MRYRVLSKGKAKHLSIPEKPAEKTASLKAADLDNPYGRVLAPPAAWKTCANKQERPLRQCRRGRFGCNLFALTAPDLKYYLLSKRAGLVVSSSGLWYTY